MLSLFWWCRSKNLSAVVSSYSLLARKSKSSIEFCLESFGECWEFSSSKSSALMFDFDSLLKLSERMSIVVASILSLLRISSLSELCLESEFADDSESIFSKF